MSNRDKRRERGPQWGRFVAGLVRDFELPDRDQLITVLHVAEEVFEAERLLMRGGEWSEMEADALDELNKLVPELWKTIELLDRVEIPLAKELAGDDARWWEEVDGLRALGNQLADVARAVPKVPRRRRGVGQGKVRHGKAAITFELSPLRKLMDVVAGYWKVTLGRRFEQNQTNWARDDDSGHFVPRKMASPAVRFAYAVIEHIAPGQGAH